MQTSILVILIIFLAVIYYLTCTRKNNTKEVGVSQQEFEKELEKIEQITKPPDTTKLDISEEIEEGESREGFAPLPQASVRTFSKKGARQHMNGVWADRSSRPEKTWIIHVDSKMGMMTAKELFGNGKAWTGNVQYPNKIFLQSYDQDEHWEGIVTEKNIFWVDGRIWQKTFSRD